MKTSLKTKLLVTSIMLAAIQNASTALATPALDTTHAITGAKVSGLGTNTTTVNQTANTAKIYWTTIDTAPNQSLNFVQPSNKSVAINYVTDGQATNFQGSLNANGKVVLINQDGMTFAAGSQVNVGALTASTADTVTETVNTSSASYGDYTFSNFGSGTVNFNGTVNTPNGYVFAMAQQVNVGSAGSINANNGSVDLETGSKSYIVDLNGNGKILYYNPTLLDNSEVSVVGNITAHSGSVIIKARADNFTSGVINLNGVIDTSSYLASNEPAGDVRLVNTSGANITGSINTQGYGSNAGGNVSILGTDTLYPTGKTNITGSINATGDYSKKSGNITVAAESINVDGTSVTANGANNFTGNSIRLYANDGSSLINSKFSAANLFSISSGGGDYLSGSFTAANISITSNHAVDDSSATLNGKTKITQNLCHKCI